MARHSRVIIRTSAVFIALLCFIPSGPARAELPEAARQMITNAAREGDKAELATIVKFARRTYPSDGLEIDKLLLNLDSAQPEIPATAPAPLAAPVQPPAPIKLLVKWSGRGDLGGFHTSGNTDSFGITVGANLTRKATYLTHQVRLRGDYQESEGKKSREYLNAAYQGDWTISDEHYALGIIDYERDVLAGFRHRTTSSLGLGWRAIREEGVTMSLEAGPAFRYEWYRDGDENSSIAARGALTSSWQMNDKVRLSHNMELVTEQDNATIRTITGLQAKLTNRISSQISYDLRYQDRPLLGKEETDTITRIGVTYDF